MPERQPISTQTIQKLQEKATLLRNLSDTERTMDDRYRGSYLQDTLNDILLRLAQDIKREIGDPDAPEQPTT